MKCWVVVVGSGVGGERDALPARGVQQRGGRRRGDRDQGAERGAAGAGAVGDEAQLGGAAARTGAAQGELPRVALGEIARGFAARVDQRRERDRRDGREGAGTFTAPPGAGRSSLTAGTGTLQGGFPGVESCKVAGVSRHGRRHILSGICFGAYGVSCRARAHALRHHLGGDSPPRPSSMRVALGPPLPLPVERGIRHERGATYHVSLQFASHGKVCNGSCRRRRGHKAMPSGPSDSRSGQCRRRAASVAETRQARVSLGRWAPRICRIARRRTLPQPGGRRAVGA